MIKAVELIGDSIEKRISFEIQKGYTKVFIFEKQEQGEEFLKMLIGMKKTKSGEVFLFGQNLKNLRRDEIFEIRKKIAIVFKTGGLINNLKAWENMLLPALYHKVLDEKEIKSKGVELLKEFEFKKEPMCRVSELTILEKRIIAIARGVLMNPEVMILEYPFDGISQSEKEWIVGKIKKIAEKLTLLYILSSEADNYLIKTE